MSTGWVLLAFAATCLIDAGEPVRGWFFLACVVAKLAAVLHDRAQEPRRP